MNSLFLVVICICFLALSCSRIEGKPLSSKLPSIVGRKKLNNNHNVKLTKVEENLFVANNGLAGGAYTTASSVSTAKSNSFIRLFVLFTVWYAFNAGCK
jgi:hypothetical protein